MTPLEALGMTEKESKYAYKKKSAWDILTKDHIKKAFDFSEEYKKFLNNAKTEREAIQEIKKIAKKHKKKILEELAPCYRSIHHRLLGKSPITIYHFFLVFI